VSSSVGCWLVGRLVGVVGWLVGLLVGCWLLVVCWLVG